MKFTEYDKAIMIGLLLGDGYIDYKGRVSIGHCEKQKDYCIFKAKLLHSVVGGKDINVREIQKISIYKKNGIIKNQRILTQYVFKKQSNSFIPFRELLYINNRKTITENVLNLLNPLAIALW